MSILFTPQEVVVVTNTIDQAWLLRGGSCFDWCWSLKGGASCVRWQAIHLSSHVVPSLEHRKIMVFRLRFDYGRLYARLVTTIFALYGWRKGLAWVLDAAPRHGDEGHSSSDARLRSLELGASESRRAGQ